MPDFCLMAPKDDAYSNVSDEDFNRLFGEGYAYTEITPQIAGQWLFNVKALNFRSYLKYTRNNSEPIEDDITEEDKNATFTSPPILFFERPRPFFLGFNPLRIYPKSSVPEIGPFGPPYSSEEEFALFGPDYYSFTVCKKLDKWYLGNSSPLLFGIPSMPVGITATMDKIVMTQSGSTSIFYESYLKELTYTVTDTYY